MKTKKSEFATLKDTLDKSSGDTAEKTKKMADSKTGLDDTKEQLEADEKFFADTKESCQERASQWAQRTRLRTMELHGIAKAIEILSSDDAKKTFDAASTTFLQLSTGDQASNVEVATSAAYERLKTLATKYGSLTLAKLAMTVHAGGHFDKVMVAIDKMIAMLREEAALDIKDRDFCENKQGKNKNDMEDLDYKIEKLTQTIERLKNEEKELEAKIENHEKDIKKTKENIEELTNMRSEEEKEFLQSVKDDTDAIKLIEKAIQALTKFYKQNKIPLELAQAVKADPRPELNWKDGNYGGRSGESGGIVSILGMLKEDFENEIKKARQADAEAQASFEKDREALYDTKEKQKELLMSTKSELSELKTKLADAEESKDQKDKDMKEEKKMKLSLTKGCAWIKSHFKKRHDKRQAEIDGLIEAKNFLAGVE